LPYYIYFLPLKINTQKNDKLVSKNFDSKDKVQKTENV